MTISEMSSVIDDLKPKFKEKFNLLDLWCNIQEIEGDSTFYKCLTVITVEQGEFAVPISIRIDISKVFVKKALETHIEHLLSTVRKGASNE